MNNESGSGVCALIGDIVSSREAPDQAGLMATLSEALDWANAHVDTVQDLEPTVGDEFQGVFAGREDAVWASLLIALRLRGTCDLRFGFGFGSIVKPESAEGYARQSGPAWWHAREAIEEAASLQGSRGWPASLRSWMRSDDPERDRAMNGFLICRDQVIQQMDEKDARVALALAAGERQEDVANELGIEQPAVSSRQRNRGPAALLRSHEALRAPSPTP